MLINLIVSIVLVKPLGISGVIIGTIASDWLTFAWYDPLILHRVGFEKAYPVSRYYLKFVKYTITTVVVGILDYIICSHVLTGFGWMSIVIHALICAVTTPAALILVSLNTQEADFIWRLARNAFKPIQKRLGK